jgi:alpha-L-arabinofuranosidase
MTVKDSDKVKLVNLSQFMNALKPIVSTELGITNGPVKRQSEKASIPMFLTVLGMDKGPLKRVPSNANADIPMETTA